MLNSNLAIYSIINIINCADIQDTHYTIARNIFSSYDDIPRMTLQEIADYAHVSTPVFRKFIKQLGFMNYYDFISDIKLSKGIRTLQFEERYLAFDREKLGGVLTALTVDKQPFSLSVIDTICKLIYESEKVVMYGATALLTLALEWQVDMRIIMGKEIVHNPTINPNIIIPNKQDVIWICSLTGRIFNAHNIELHTYVFSSEAKKIMVTKKHTMKQMNSDIEIILDVNNEVAEAQYLYLYYLDCIKYRYYELYIKKKEN